jgi:splicing factor 3B subunit 2
MLLLLDDACECAQVDKTTRWGDLESEEEEESEAEEEEEEEEEVDTESLADGISSIASGYNSSLPSGIETPEVLNLRKGAAGASSLQCIVVSQMLRKCDRMAHSMSKVSEQDCQRYSVLACAGEKPLYQVLEQRAAAVGDNLLGSDHTYVIPGAGGAAAAAAKVSGAAAARKCAPPHLC